MSHALSQYVGVLRLLLRGAQDRPALVYDLLSTTGFFTERTLYLNLGYWDGARTLDDACERLADLLGAAADLREGDIICDCGFGFGDQDIHWSTRFNPARIEGLNITASQVAVAHRRVAAAGLSDRIHLSVGSATSMPFKSERFDKVVALETAFHYDTREDFLPRPSASCGRPGDLRSRTFCRPTGPPRAGTNGCAGG